MNRTKLTRAQKRAVDAADPLGFVAAHMRTIKSLARDGLVRQHVPMARGVAVMLQAALPFISGRD